MIEVRAVDHVGGETDGVGDVVDIDLLELEEPGGAAEGAVDGNRALVVAIGGRDGGAVEFGAKKRTGH